jgi:hypothetical protein
MTISTGAAGSGSTGASGPGLAPGGGKLPTDWGAGTNVVPGQAPDGAGTAGS